MAWAVAHLPRFSSDISVRADTWPVSVRFGRFANALAKHALAPCQAYFYRKANSPRRERNKAIMTDLETDAPVAPPTFDAAEKLDHEVAPRNGATKHKGNSRLYFVR